MESWNRTDRTYLKCTTLQGSTTHTTAHGLADNVVLGIAIDQTGHKWFGTNSGGVTE